MAKKNLFGLCTKKYNFPNKFSIIQRIRLHNETFDQPPTSLRPLLVPGAFVEISTNAM